MKHLFAILFLLLSLPQAGRAQPDTVYGRGYLQPPSADTLQTAPDAAQWQQLSAHKTYAAYKDAVEFHDVIREEKKATQSLRWLGGILKFFGSTAGLVLLLTVFGALAAWLIYRWLKNKGGHLFYKDKKFSPAATQPESPEDLAQDWQQLMQKSADTQDYRAAVRFGYLWLLQTLHDRAWIDYHPNKTNRQYAREIKQPAANALFVQLSRHYEQSWYGNRPDNAETFDHFRQQLDQIQRGQVA